MDHAIMPISSADKWVYCPGWPIMANACPDESDNTSADEGTLSHELIPRFIQPSYPGREACRKISSAMPGVTDEIFEGAFLAAETMHKIMVRHRSFNIQIEQKVRTDSWINPHVWGTCDAVLSCPNENTLYIFDYKFGHLKVSPFENWQMIGYLAGVLNGMDRQTDGMKIIFVIIQPRSYHRDGPVRQWETTFGHIRSQGYINQMRHAANACLAPDPQCVAGPHCRFCNARSRCDAFGDYANAAMDFIGEPMPDEMDGESIGIYLDMLKSAQDAIKYRMTGLAQQASAMLARGEYVQGYALKKYYGNQTWVGGPEAAIAVGDAMGLDIRKPGTMTPNQAIGAGMDKEAVEEMTHRPLRGSRLEKMDEERAHSIFGQKVSG